jgi:ABC-type lipoprotein release transport system permease subunit
MSTFRIAWRNLWRNRRRTSLALAAIGLSVALVLAYDSILRSYGDWMVTTITGPMLGDVQIHATGWREDRSMDRTICCVDQLLEVLRRDPGAADATARVYAPALAASDMEGFAVLVVGVDVVAESQPMRLLEGAPSRPGHGQVLLGQALATQIGSKPGEQIALVGQGADGSLANDLFTVAGLISTSVDAINRQGVIMPLEDAQALFAMPGEAHEIVVHARDPERVKALAAGIAARHEFGKLEVLDWQTLAPEMLSLIQIVNVAWIFVLVLVLIAAAAGIANTMLMATFERQHEFGMLLALGTGPARLVQLVVAESIVLGMLGTLLGVAAGLTLVLLTRTHGVDYAALTGGGPSEISFGGLRWSLRLYPRLAVIDITRTVLAVVITSIVASAWPAVRVTRLEPATALRA